MLSIVRSSCVALFVAFSVLAADAPWNGAPLTADPKAMLAAAEAVPAGESPVVVLLDEQHYTFDDAGRATIETRIIFRVADESAVDDWSTIEAEWAPWYQEKPDVAARIIGKDGSVHMLDAKTVTESAARDESPEIFSDNRLLRAPLPGMAGGVVVEQVVTYHDHNPLFQTGTSGRLMFGRYVPVQQTRLMVDAPSSLALHFVNKSAPHLEPVKTEENGRQHIVFESARIEPLEHLESNLPYDTSAVPYVAFSTGAAWQEVARRYTEIVEKQIGDTAAVQPFVRSAIGKSSDRHEIVSKALAAIQKNIRYAGIEVGEGSIVPRAPKDVLALKYGDCKDKATLLVAMLRAAGIPAHVALLNAGTDLDVDAELPSVSRFNHVIVRVGGESEGDAFWVDPTDEYSPAGVLPIADQDRLALVADASTTALARTPAADSSANLIRETRTFTLADEGKAAVSEVTESTGAADAYNRRYAATTDKKSYREGMESYAKETYVADSLKSVDHTDPRDLSKPFRLTLEIEGAARGQTGDIDSAVAIFPSALTGSLPWALRTVPDEKEEEKKPSKPREHDFVVPMPHVRELHYRIVPPPGFVARTLPPNENKQLGVASLTTTYETAADGAVNATLRFDSGKRRLTPAEMETTRKAVSALAESNAVIIGFDSIGWTKLNAGDIGGAIAEFRRLSTLHAKEARHHVQVGRAYFVGGMGEAAREELRRAIALEPDYAPAHRFLGIALQHDLLAREFRKGFDLAGAIAEYRKAKELAPKEVETRGELAKLLARGDDGELCSKGAHLAESIDEYKAIANDLKDHRYDDEMLTVMAHAGRFDEMKALAREVKDDDERMTALVIAAAATDGVDAAMREAASVDTNARRRILAAAFPTLLQLRLYPQAAALLDQASQGAPNATQMRPFIDVLRRTKRYEDLQLGDDPKSVVLRLSYLAALTDDPETALRDYVASWLVAFEDKMKAEKKKRGDTSEEEDELAAMRTRARQQADGLPRRVTADLGLAAMDTTPEGSDATGYRVRLRVKSGAPGAQGYAQTFHVVRENGRYVIAAATYGSTAVTVLHFVEQNDLETARVWLNWAREDISAGGGDDDPLAGPTFASLWPKAKATATADEIRAAAAALLVTDADYAPAAAPLLVAARETVPDALKVRVDIALLQAYETMDEPAQALVVARRIAAVAPDSATAFLALAGTLTQNGNAEEAQKLAQARLQKLPNDPAAVRMLSRAAMQSGDFESADKYVRQLIDRSDATAGDYNNVAWNALFTGKPLDRAIEDANQAVSLSGDWASVHTLAALYAEAGNSLEARTKLLECMDLAGREEPASVDWYVLGRIAENYGATDAALAAYKRVTKPKHDSVGSTYALAQRRVQTIGKK